MASTDTYSLLKAGKLQGSTQLKLSIGLKHFPQEIYDLADSLEILDLTGNALSSLPDDLHRFKKLRILFCSANQFTHMPEVLGECPNLSMIGFKANQIKHIPESAIPKQNLRWFIVTDNVLTKLPNALGECSKLQKLMLSGNQLTALPSTMENCHALELLRLSANQFQALPDWLFKLPKLTWLAYAGNPFSNVIEQSRLKKFTVDEIDWQTLELQHELGQGASGITYQAIWRPANRPTETVAVKLFKGNLTSDGLPSCEMSANILAGEHANLIGIKGVIRNHPKQTQGLVMPLLDASLSILAGPPSFETCSRDVYPETTTFSQEDVFNLLTSIASATSHLHTQGLMHGDLYAHNILWNHQHTVLSDLGGASFLPSENGDLAKNLQRLESRAFGVLLEEVLNRSKLDANISEALWQLQKTCVAEALHSTPDFNEIIKQIAALK